MVELKPVRGVGDCVEQSARDALKQIFEYDFDDENYGRGRLVHYAADSTEPSKPVAGKKYKVYLEDGEDGAASRSSVSLASTFNRKGIVGVRAYECVPSNERHNYQTNYIFRDCAALLLVPHERSQ